MSLLPFPPMPSPDGVPEGSPAGLVPLQRRDDALVDAMGPGRWSPLRAGTSPDAAHGVDVHLDDAEQVTRLTAYVLGGLDDGDTCLVIARRSHCTALQQSLDIIGTAGAPGRLVTVDAEATLASLLRDGRPQADLFEDVVAGLVRAETADGARLRAYGEMVGILAAAGQLAAALELEKMWEALQERYRFVLLCAYPSPVDELTREALRRSVHEHHSHAVSALA